jgi:hypothetical protein
MSEHAVTAAAAAAEACVPTVHACASCIALLRVGIRKNDLGGQEF